MAPVVETEQRIGYDEARELVLDCYRTFSPELGATVEEFFTGDHIDARRCRESAAAPSAPTPCRPRTRT